MGSNTKLCRASSHRRGCVAHAATCILIYVRHQPRCARAKGRTPLCFSHIQALREIHAQGVLHGDIRAENVLVAPEGGRWKVMHLSPPLSYGCAVQALQLKGSDLSLMLLSCSLLSACCRVIGVLQEGCPSPPS